jgi:hypothetical protein
METVLQELLETRWTNESTKHPAKSMRGQSWWKKCGYGWPCKEAYEAGFKKGYTPYAMKDYKYLDYEEGITSGFESD